MYVLKISMGFYKIPIVVAFLVALLVACLQNRALSFDEKLELMGKGIGDKNIVTMILIFMAAGIFVGVVGRSSAESVAYFLLSIIPSKYSVAVLFVISCFVSTAMGTSVGTITLIVPIALPIAAASGYSLPLCIATVMGGAMFGDNLSFISDTTIAACNGQGCAMKDKFRENFWIALPAALVTLALILILTLGADVHPAELPGYNLIQIIPYVLVLIGGIAGINVFVVLLVGIVSGSIIMLATGATAATDLLVNMGAGASGMFETTMVAILVAAICALIREYGGFDALLYGIKKVFRGKKGGQLGMGHPCAFGVGDGQPAAHADAAHFFTFQDILFKLYGVGQAAAFLHQFHQLVDRRRQRIRLLAQRHAAGLQVICDVHWDVPLWKICTIRKKRPRQNGAAFIKFTWIS